MTKIILTKLKTLRLALKNDGSMIEMAAKREDIEYEDQVGEIEVEKRILEEKKNQKERLFCTQS